MSDTTALWIRQLHVRSTPGIKDAFKIEELSKGLNLIYGPNASGKTTTARALEAVLWPKMNSKRRLSVAAQYRFGSSDYVVDLDAGHVGVQLNGTNCDAPDLPAPEFRERYHLSLHDLLLAPESDKFAEEVAKQSAGGYDLTTAAKELGCLTKPSTASSDYRTAEDARARLKEAHARQVKLHAEAQSLQAIEARYASAKPARLREAFLQKAIHRARMAAAVDSARTRVSEFSPLHAKIRGDESERMRAVTEQLHSVTAEEVDAKMRLSVAEREAAEAFPNGTPPLDRLPSLEADVKALREKERALDDTERRISSASASLAEARRAIGVSVTDDQLTAIENTAFGELVDFARAAEQSAGALAAAEAELRRAGDDAAPADLQQINNGIRLLVQWLEGAAKDAHDTPESSRRKMFLVASAVLSVVGWIVLAAVWKIEAGAGLVLSVALLVLGSWHERPASSSRASREQEYATLGLPVPDAWVSERVIAILKVLHQRLADGQLAERRAEWRMEAGRLRDDILARRQTLEARREKIAARFGVAPDTDARQLSWLADRIGRWQDAFCLWHGVRADAEQHRTQYNQLLDRITEQFAPFNVGAPTTASSAEGAVAALATRLNTFGAAAKTANQIHSLLASLGIKRRELAEAMESLLTIEANRVAANEVNRLCDEHDEYRSACEDLRVAERELWTAQAAVEADRQSTPEVTDVSEEELEAERAEAAALAEEYDSLADQLTRLRTRLDQAKQESDIEQALADVASAEAALQAARASDFRAMVGDALVRHVQHVSRDEHRPAVFHRAREIFTTITRGRYLLNFADGEVGGTSTFRALDQRTGLGHSLDELSSATRVQLLLAVRVAFVESQEHGVRLPLLLDETLGTSDDHRASAIIDAILTLAEGGRQIFYFTAQQDEVAKWTSALQARQMNATVIDLAAIRGVSGETIKDIPFAAVTQDILPSVPSCEGHTHDSYGDALAVPGIPAGAGRASATHLWYLIDELPTLERLLLHGIATWGELDNLVRHGAVGIPGKYPEVYARAVALARVVTVLQEQLSIGQGRPVTRTVLVESGAVSDRKIDDVMEVVHRCNGNARLFMDMLDRREVPGFQAKKVADLRAYLENEGYLDPQPSSTAEEVRSAMQSAAIPGIESKVLVAGDVDTLLRRSTHRASQTGIAMGGMGPMADVPLSNAIHAPGLPA